MLITLESVHDERQKMTKIGIMMIHGTMGCPKEFFPLENFLKSQDILTLAIALPGHGERPRKYLNQVSASDILDHCRASYDQFTQECDYVYLVGQSLGGLCSLVVASENPKKLGGVITFAAPYEYAYFVNYGHGLLKFPFANLGLSLMYAPESFTHMNPPVFMPWWYPIFYREAEVLFDNLQSSLSNVQVPVILTHSPYDLIVPYEEMEKIYQKINKPHLVTMHRFENCGHQIFPYSREKEKAMEMIYQFVLQHTEHQQKAAS
jgi:carboxylesterase